MGKSTERSNTTDKLVIDIKVNVKKGATTQITNLTKSLTELNKVVAKVGNLERYANALRQIGGRATKVTANKGVTKAQLGNNITQIDDMAFAYCSSLRYINSDKHIVLPPEIKEINTAADRNKRANWHCITKYVLRNELPGNDSKHPH